MGIDEKVLFRPVNENSASVYEKVIAELKKGIMQGELQPGDKLPSERDLSKMLGVSRTSLREALKLLEVSGVVTIKHGQGVFIANNDSNEYIKKFISSIYVDEKKLAELFQIRKILETEAAVWACRNGTDEQLEGIYHLVKETMDELEKNPKNEFVLLAKQDGTFHHMLAESANNSVLTSIMDNLLELLADSRARAVAVEGRPNRSLKEHWKIAQALLKRDAEGARQAMLEHLNNVESDLLTKRDKG
ncbi:MAG: FadR/GntR family transcriptional regulator [Bacillota bacterium]